VSVAALALLLRRDAPCTPVCGTPFFLDVLITVNNCGSDVKGRPQAAFFLCASTVEGGAVPSSAPPARALALVGG
jgi:hypothetical protein